VRLFKQFILRRLTTERMRTAVAVGGIALGVAVVLAIRLANQSSVSGFASALDAMSGAASLEIVAPAGGIDEQRLAQLDWLSEFGAVSPVIEGDVVAPASQGSPEALRVLGVDILRDLAFREYRLIEFSGGQRQPRPQEFLRLLVDSEAVVLTAVSALDDPSVSDVAAAIGSTRQNVTQLVTALERKGMLRVDDDPMDNRRRVLTTTRLSDNYWEQRNAGDYDALVEWFGMLDGNELHGLCDALGRVAAGRQSASR